MKLERCIEESEKLESDKKLYKAFYNSPIGCLEIISTKDYLIRINILICADEKKQEETCEILEKTIKQLDEYFNKTRTEFDLPILLEGTSFRKLVWNELIKIPYGNTISYKELAKLINKPKAYRAVGQANHYNPIPIIVPCHRVIAIDGNFGGYAGGYEAKNFLIELERDKG